LDYWALTEIRGNLESEADLVTTLLDVIGGYGLAGFRGDMHEFARQSRDLACFIARVETNAIPVRIAVVGDFSSGKSSFINSVLQDPNLCPERADPTTSLVTTFTYGPEECILQHQSDGHVNTVSREQYAAIVQAPQADNAPVYFTFQLPVPLLMGLELMDTPGFNNPKNPGDSHVTTGIMKDADAFFYLVDAEKGTIAKTGLQQVQQIKKESNDAQVFLLISKADGKSMIGLDKIKAQYRKEHAELFHDRILTYSSIEVRPDLDSREDLSELFHAFQRDKALLVKGTMKRRLKSHRDLRMTRARSLQDTLLELADTLDQEIESREAILTKVFNRLMEVWNGETKRFFLVELTEAVETNVKPTKKKGSGFFVDYAEIFFSSISFHGEIQDFSSFKTIEEALHDTIVALFGNTRADLHRETLERCKAARCECAKIAGEKTRSLWGADLSMRFDSITKAHERYRAVYWERTTATANEVWTEWERCFDSLCEGFVTEFLGAPSEALNRRREILAAGVDQWKNLIETMPEP
jgi:GTPase SAR1 family protein